MLEYPATLGLAMTLQAPQLAFTLNLVEGSKSLLAACVFALVEPSKVRPTTKIRSRDKAVLNLKREEECMKTPHFQKPVHPKTRAYTQKIVQYVIYQEI